MPPDDAVPVATALVGQTGQPDARQGGLARRSSRNASRAARAVKELRERFLSTIIL